MPNGESRFTPKGWRRLLALVTTNLTTLAADGVGVLDGGDLSTNAQVVLTATVVAYFGSVGWSKYATAKNGHANVPQ